MLKKKGMKGEEETLEGNGIEKSRQEPGENPKEQRPPPGRNRIHKKKGEEEEKKKTLKLE